MENVTENIVAVLPTNEQVIDQSRDTINGEIAVIRKKAEDVSITTQQEYEDAAEIAKDIKRKTKAVKELFQPIKDAANKAHKMACSQERMMLDPLDAADKLIRAAMAQYTQRQEQERRRIEEEARRLREIESEKLLQEAVKAEQSGDAQDADNILAEAQIMQETPSAIAPAAEKVKGVSYRVDYEIEVVDETKVPVEIGGAVIRPVDQRLVLRLVKATGGKMNIPGIKVREIKKTVIRT